MSASSSQNFANHVRWFPPYHFVTGPLLFASWLFFLWQLKHGITAASVIAVVFSTGVLLTYFFSRYMALRVQDRLIRLEERLRMARLLPPAMQGRIDEFSMNQLLALRFASDAELPVLAERVLTAGTEDKTAIKKMITTWRADHRRI